MKPGPGLALTSGVYNQMLSHVLRARPREAVGLLAGSAAGEVSRVLPLDNIAPGDRAFLADPFSQYNALRRLREDKLELLAIYHSHPDGGVDPSPDDLAHARRWACAHVVIAIGAGMEAKPRVRAFLCADRGSVMDIGVRIQDRSSSRPPPSRRRMPEAASSAPGPASPTPGRPGSRHRD
jgi:proteasome lid subunit RPN8/RPN11